MTSDRALTSAPDPASTPAPDRPRYRALVRAWYDHEADDRAHRPTHRHEAWCVAGYEVTIYRVDAYWLAAGGDRAHVPLGVARVDDAAWRDAWLVQDTVAAWLRLRAAPRPTHVEPADVEVYREVRTP